MWPQRLPRVQRKDSQRPLTRVAGLDYRTAAGGGRWENPLGRNLVTPAELLERLRSYGFLVDRKSVERWLHDLWLAGIVTGCHGRVRLTEKGEAAFGPVIRAAWEGLV